MASSVTIDAAAGVSYLAFGRPNFGDEEIAAVSRVMRSGWIGMGSEVMAFERELAEACGAPQVVTVSSCTAALFLSLRVLGIGPGDEVVCPALTWCSSANAALYLGARPVFCDIDADTLCATPATIAARVTPRTRAVVVVHYGGLAVDVAALRRSLPDGVAIVEDAAHAMGARYPDGGPVGSSGNLTCFSFYANKNLSTGEGGAVALADGKLAEHLRVLRLHGLPTDAWQRFTNPMITGNGTDITELGYKMNFTDLQAAIGRVQLRRQPEFASVRREIARHYESALTGPGLPLRLQAGVTEPHHARHLAVLILAEGTVAADRDALLLRLRTMGIGASVHYKPLHHMSLYQDSMALPVTDTIAGRILTLPISASMTMDDARRVTDGVLKTL